MLSASQAHTIADRIISLAQQARIEEWNSKSPPIPLAYRCTELSALEPWQRQQVIAFALESVNSRWPVMIALAAWIIAFFAVFFFVVAYDNYAVLPLVVVLFLAGGPPMWVRAMLARNEIKEAARMLVVSGRVEG